MSNAKNKMKKNTKELKGGKNLIFWGLILYAIFSAVQVLASFFGGAGNVMDPTFDPTLEAAKKDLTNAIFALLCIVPLFLAVVGFGAEWKKYHVTLDNVTSWFLVITILSLNVSATSILPPEMLENGGLVSFLNLLIDAVRFLYLIPLYMKFKTQNKTLATLALCAFLWVTVGGELLSFLQNNIEVLRNSAILSFTGKVIMLGVWAMHIMIALEYKKSV